MDLVDGILFLAPGFLALKLFHLVGAQRAHSQWEWTTWSVVISLPINAAASQLRPWIDRPIESPDPYEVALRMVIATVAGLVAAGWWIAVRGSKRESADRFRRMVNSSAWDMALEDVQRDKRPVELVLDDGTSIIGTVCYGGREDNEAEGWIYLTWPETIQGQSGKHEPTPKTIGFIVHRDKVARIRVLTTKKEGQAAREAKARAEASTST